MKLHENLPVEQFSVKKNAVLNRIKMFLMRMCLYCSWQLFRGSGALQPCLMIRSSWERSDMEVWQGGGCCCFSCKENFRMLRFPTAQRMRLDLLCHFFIQSFLKNYLPSPVHIIKVLYCCIYFTEAWGPCLHLRQVRLSH